MTFNHLYLALLLATGLSLTFTPTTTAASQAKAAATPAATQRAELQRRDEHQPGAEHPYGAEHQPGEEHQPGAEHQHNAEHPDADAHAPAGEYAERAPQHAAEADHDHAKEENHSRITDAMASASGIVTALAAPGEIQSQAHLFGVISAMPERQLRISAPYAGLVQQVAVRVGDRVRQGQLLATVQNSATLKSYPIVAPQAGEITGRFLNSGEKVTDQPLLELSDFSEVYLELSVFPTELARLQTGQPVQVYDLHQTPAEPPQPDAHDHSGQALGQPAAAAAQQSTISYIAPQMTAGHIARARALLANPQGRWRPGMHVQADVMVEAKTAAVRIEQSALQRLEQQWVVFVKQGEQYRPAPVRLGLRDDRYVEVTAGLQPGETYVVQNSFLLKADLQKSGASHQH